MIYLLRPRLQHYDWGSPTKIPALLGTEPDGRPVAEAWYGAHFDAPSEVKVDDVWVPLNEFCAQDLERTLGRDGGGRVRTELPYLMKLLASDRPLSIQVHPSPEQARAGFEKEQAQGIARTDPTRSYRDPNAKPETIFALEPFQMLCGFRPADELVRLFEDLAIDGLDPMLTDLRSPVTPVRKAAERLLAIPAGELAGLVAQVAETAPGLTGWDLGWIRHVAELYPADPGVIFALMLNYHVLPEGDAAFLRARTPHAYLSGFGVEIMRSSDNVLRAGLTHKTVRPEELVRIVDWEARSDPVMQPDQEPGGAVLDPGVGAFALHVVDLGGRVDVAAEGPQIVLCLAGGGEISSDGNGHELAKGQAAFVEAAGGPIEMRGEGSFVRATTGTNAPKQ